MSLTCNTAAMLLLSLVLAACGTSEPSPSPPSETPSEETAGTSEEPPGETTESETTESETTQGETAQGEAETEQRAPVELLHAVPASVAASSAYRDSAAQVGRLVDGDLESAWNSRTGELQGAWIDFRLPDDATVTAVRMTAGFTHVTERADLFTGNHRVARVRVSRGGETVAEAALDIDDRGLQTIPVEGGGGDYRIEIVELAAGSRDDWRETCISELRVMGRAPDTHPRVYTPRTAIGALPALGPVLEGDALDDAEEALDEADDAELDALIDQTAMLYIAQQEGPGLAMDETGGVERIAGARTFARDPEGWVWTCAVEGTPTLRTPEGEVLLPVEASCGPLAVGADRHAWVLSRNVVHAFGGSAWTTLPSHGVSRANDIAVDGEGTLFVVGPTSVARRRGDAFEPVAINGPVERIYRVLAAGSHVVAQHAGGLLRLEGAALAPITVDGPRGPVRGFGAIALAPDGTLVAIHEFSQSMYVSRAGAPTRRLSFAELEGRPLSIRALTFDGQARLWMWADSGLTIVGPTDFTQVVRRYAPGSLPDLTGASLGGEVTGWVRGLYVERDGPTLPRGETPAGRVHGRLVRAGAPLAGQSLLFCTNPMRGNLGSGYSDPCEETSESEYGFVRRVRTRDDGTFDFWDAPEEETVHLVTMGHGGWFYSPARACCQQLRAGRTVDMGDVEIP